jgi:sec-independent protein translocase protein TatC
MNPLHEDTLIGHLAALRRALIAALLIMAVGFIAGICLSGRLIDYVFALPRSRGFSLYLFYLTDAIMLRLRVGALFGVLATSPLWVIPIFRFVAEGLSRRETNMMTAFGPVKFVLRIPACVRWIPIESICDDRGLSGK